MNWKDKKIIDLKGVGEQKAKILHKKFGLISYHDLLFYFPYRYDNINILYTTSNIPIKQKIKIKGKISHLKEIVYGKGKKRLVAVFRDEFGCIELVWFKITKQLLQSIYQDTLVVIYGKVTEFNGKLSMSHPDIELYSRFINHKITYIPKYSLADKGKLKQGFTNRWVQSIYKNLFDEIEPYINENLPQDILIKFKLFPRNKALKNMHFPESQFKLDQSRYRLKFEEFFFFQLRVILKKLTRIRKNNVGHPCYSIGFYFNEFYKKYLPFVLTNAQKKVIKEIRYDMKKSIQMNRLLQGDVGSGKTIVALMAMLIAIDNGFQVCLMTPTTILAMQHFRLISKLLLPLNITVELLSRSTTLKKRNQIITDLKNGNLKILIGTHTILEEKVKFKNLALAIIDEQHRFGVIQRSRLWFKNSIPPHILVMTATPIPRTLAMSYYADLDLSIINELPKGRKPVHTFHIYESQRYQVIKFLKNQIDKGFQAYYVYPIIKESKVLEYKDLINGFNDLCTQFPTPNYQISVVHGRMSNKEKELEIYKFIDKKTQLMVASTVIEVGINIPNASVMIIENAERFGLSQLHQLRGRVGRGNQKSYCILITKSKLSKEAAVRIKTMCKINDGFKIAEVDLQVRGAGNLLGTQQSGMIDFKFINLIEDKKIIFQIREYVIKLLKSDPKLKNYQMIKKYLFQEFHSKFRWGKIS